MPGRWQPRGLIAAALVRVLVIAAATLTSAESHGPPSPPEGPATSSSAALSAAAVSPAIATVLPGDNPMADDEAEEPGIPPQRQDKPSLQTAPSPDPTKSSSRTVTTKYGSLRGLVITLDNRHLEPVEVRSAIFLTVASARLLQHL